MNEAVRILLYALVAAASPTALLATLAVLSSKRGRLNGIVFMAGFVLAQSIVLIVVYILGSTANDTPRDTVNAYVELAVGAALIVISLIRPNLPHRQAPRTSPRTEAVLERLRGVTPGLALGFGSLLGVGAKRLAITIVAAGTLALSAQSGAQTVWLAVLYVVVATFIVWFPVVYSAILGRRAEDLVARTRKKTEGRGGHYLFIAGLVLGVVLVAHALGRLLA